MEKEGKRKMNTLNRMFNTRIVPGAGDNIFDPIMSVNAIDNFIVDKIIIDSAVAQRYLSYIYKNQRPLRQDHVLFLADEMEKTVQKLNFSHPKISAKLTGNQNIREGCHEPKYKPDRSCHAGTLGDVCPLHWANPGDRGGANVAEDCHP